MKEKNNKAVELFKEYGPQRHILCGILLKNYASEGGFETNTLCPLKYFLEMYGFNFRAYGDIRGNRKYYAKRFVPFWTVTGLKETIESYGVPVTTDQNFF